VLQEVAQTRRDFLCLPSAHADEWQRDNTPSSLFAKGICGVGTVGAKEHKIWSEFATLYASFSSTSSSQTKAQDNGMVSDRSFGPVCLRNEGQVIG
jgi:hypothetical protein